MKKKKLISIITLVLSFALVTGCNKENSSSVTPVEPPHQSPDDTETIDVDEEYAKEVIDLINTLNDNSTEQEINYVAEKYNDLTDRQKLLVTNYDTLQEYVDILDVLRLINRINSIIDSLNEENPNIQDVEEAKTLYNEIANTYGVDWQNRISAEKVQKLSRCEQKACDLAVTPLISKAVTLDIAILKEATQFTLLNQRIEKLEEVYDHSLIENIEGYNALLTKRTKAAERFEIIGSDYYSTTHDIGEKFLTELPIVENDDYGYVSIEEFHDYVFPEGNKSGDIQVATQHNFEAYEKIALFVSWPVYTDRITIINNEEAAFFASPVIENEFIYIEIPVKQLKDKKGIGHTHIAGFLENKDIGASEGLQYKYTALVGIGVDKDAAQDAVDEVDLMIEALTIDSDVEDIAAARNAYDAIGTNYGVESQEKVKPQTVTKLAHLENAVAAKEVNVLIAKANSIELENNRSYVQFVLLSDEIQTKYNALEDEQKSLLVGYDTYLAKKVIADKDAVALYNDNVTSSTLGLNKVSDPDYGHVFKESYAPSYRKAAIEIKLNELGSNWSNYLTFGFFAKYDVVNDENLILPLDQAWNKTVYATRTLIDSSSHLYYYEFNMSTVNEPLASNFDAYIQLYFSNNTTEYMITGLVAFIDHSADELNNYIALANSLDLTSNQGKAHFELLSDFIDTKYSTLDASKRASLVGYDTYVSNKSQLSGVGILFKDMITTDHNGDYPELESIPSELFGTAKKYTYNTDKTNNVYLFAIASGQNWSGHSKLGLFFKINCASPSVSMVIDNKYAERVTIAPALYEAENYIYYVEYDISPLGNLNGNPYFLIDLSSSTNVLMSSNIVYFN